MMRVKTEIGRSKVHGYGVFALETITKGEVVWSFSRLFDYPVYQHVLARAEASEQQKLIARGFRNPHDTENIVMCGDEAQFMNFPFVGGEPNVVISGAIDGYDILVAARDIAPGEELLVEPASDLDYTVKVLGYGPVSEGENKAQ